MTGGDCVLCGRAAALDANAAADRGWLLRTGSWGVSVHPAVAAPGWVAVQTLRHTEGLADLDAAEAAELGPLLARLAAAVTRVTGSGRVYTYSLGEGCPHTHVLLGPPQRERRGAAFLTGLLRRDATLADEAAAARTAARLAAELTDTPTDTPAEEPTAALAEETTSSTL
jgi:diadenosine tetraphosphate (Ap4A) HIT family hydrolase